MRGIYLYANVLRFCLNQSIHHPLVYVKPGGGYFFAEPIIIYIFVENMRKAH